jgi:ParB family transcriptional regulator, chromosome partitioning protein
MSQKKMVLGKGMASLLKEAPEVVFSPNLTKAINIDLENKNKPILPELVDISQIIANPNQPRKIFKEKELQELAQSIKENGLIQPLVVAENNGKFELIAGERRLKASKMAGLERVPVIVKNATEKERMVMSIIENVQRADLNCVEEALAYFHLMDEYKLTQEEVAKKLGKERSSVANFLRVLKLPRPVIELLQKEKLSFGHAKVLASVIEREEAIRFAELTATENLSIRELEELIKRKKIKPVKERQAVDTNKYESLRESLEKRTGFHFDIKAKKNGAGEFILKFNNEAEFNDLYEFLNRTK